MELPPENDSEKAAPHGVPRGEKAKVVPEAAMAAKAEPTAVIERAQNGSEPHAAPALRAGPAGEREARAPPEEPSGGPHQAAARGSARGSEVRRGPASLGWGARR